MRLSVDQTEAHAKHLLFARGKRREHFFKLLAQQRIRRLFRRLRGFVVLNEIAQMAVLFLADRRLQRHRFLRDFQNFLNLGDLHVKLLRNLRRRRLAPELLDHGMRRSQHAVDRLDHMYRDADGPRLIGNRARDGLANPPGGVG